MATDSSSKSADSYLGSIISLISKSEIRYEGVLFHVNAPEKTIALQNVRSFGTEGRRKDGPEVPASEKVYEFICFRGTDIKDLQVLSSPAIRSKPTIPDDSAIIQSHYLPPASASGSTTLPPVLGSVTSFSTNAQLGLPGSSYQGSPHQMRNIGSWASSHPSHVDGNEHVMPMYWQGCNGFSGGVCNLQQQSLLQTPPCLLGSSSGQQHLQYSTIHASLPGGSPNFHELSLPLLQPLSNGSPKSISTTTASSALPSNLPIGGSAALASGKPNRMENNESGLPTVTLTSSLPLVPPLTSSGLDSNAVVHQIVDKPKTVCGSTSSHQSVPTSMPSVVGILSSDHMEASTTSLVTPAQLLHSGPTKLPSSNSLHNIHKDIEVVLTSTSESLSANSKEASLSKLPLKSTFVEKSKRDPSHSQHHDRGHEQGRRNGLHGAHLHNPRIARSHVHSREDKLNRASSYTCHFNRELVHGGGNRVSHAMTKFIEDFDFVAMNEKFIKEEVWGDLGKRNKAKTKDEQDANSSDEANVPHEDVDGLSKVEINPVYVKDNFFDLLSCNALNHESRKGRVKFSEQMKLDKETFGDFRINRRGRAGRGQRWSGGSQGSQYGRGCGHAGSGGVVQGVKSNGN